MKNTTEPTRSRRARALALGAATLLLASASARGDVRQEIPRVGPVPANARSVVMSAESGITIMVAPGFDGAIAGRALPGASFPALETRRGAGCRRLWVRIGQAAWVCGDHAEFSDAAPPTVALQNVRPPAGELLPWQYAFTSHDDTRAYRSAAAALRASTDPSDYELWESNWGFATVATTGVGAARVLRSYNGWYLRRSDLYRASPSTFVGGRFEELEGNEPGVPFGWVALAATRVYNAPSESAPSEGIERLTPLRVYATREDSRGRVFARIGQDRWVRAQRVRWIAPSPPPAGVNVAARERWIDVDLSTQTLVAYEGGEPVYATMVSSGRGQFATPPGVFRIHSRFLSHTMDNTESAGLPNHFRLGDVPYIQFFDGDRGFHAVYWHDGFGIARSHGCVNLAPRDAEYLFTWTARQMPAGWASMNIPAGEGTLVRVRGEYRYE